MQLQKIRLGDLLVEQQLITEEQLKKALAEQQQQGGQLGTTLIALGFIKQEVLLNTLAEQLRIPLIDIKNYQFKAELVYKLPETYARRYRAIVLAEEEGEFVVGMVDPQDLYAYGEISRILQGQVQPALVEESALIRAIDLLYRQTQEIMDYAEELSVQLGRDKADVMASVADEMTGGADAPVAKLLDSVFSDAVQVRASDIHIEPDEDILRIRLRVDGLLQEQVMKRKDIASALIQRLKLMAGLDIAEKRLPQDGRFNIQVSGRVIDVRLATMPVQHGESVVMRLLDQASAKWDYDQLGMPMEVRERLRKQIHRPHGMVLVTGPTGSGKTTTIYCALQELNTIENKVITVEDPVEYRLPRVNQVQVNSKIDLTFARVLRAILRNDPDIIMVGEIRDSETATIALRAAMTGHLVLATLHTNDARSSAMRLVDIGVESYLVAVALRAVLAQRLIRKICDNCREPYQPNNSELQWLLAISGEKYKTLAFSKGKGCTHCSRTGYTGRVGVFELLEMNNEMMEALRTNDSNAFFKAIDTHPNAKHLGIAALELAAKGTTTLEEVMRVAEELEYKSETVCQLV